MKQKTKFLTGRLGDWVTGRFAFHRQVTPSPCRPILFLLPFALCLLPLAFANTETGSPKQSGNTGATQPVWKQALPPYSFKFPADHASHDDYKLEWWYYTGNLNASDGRKFGYQLTFFRLGVEQKPQNPSRWAVRDLYAAHLAVTDINGKKFHFADKLSRAGIDFAGAATDRYHVWNETWDAQLNAAGEHQLQASDNAIGLSFTLAPGKAAIIHGENGVSQKGTQAGNASHYYSFTRMPTRGTLTLDGERIEVSGTSWMDHEFGTSYLEAGQLGWDWFSLQLDDGSELMLYRFRRQDGSLDRLSSGTFIDAAGKVTRLAFDDFTLTPAREWASDSGARYPVEWQIKLPKLAMDLNIRAAIDQQEMRTEGSTGVSYWEGAIEINGSANTQPLKGRGYLEMTGYAGQAMGAVMQ
jgi:predicted secreted hydrolase